MHRKYTTDNHSSFFDNPENAIAFVEDRGGLLSVIWGLYEEDVRDDQSLKDALIEDYHDEDEVLDLHDLAPETFLETLDLCDIVETVMHGHIL